MLLNSLPQKFTKQQRTVTFKTQYPGTTQPVGNSTHLKNNLQKHIAAKKSQKKKKEKKILPWKKNPKRRVLFKALQSDLWCGHSNSKDSDKLWSNKKYHYTMRGCQLQYTTTDYSPAATHDVSRIFKSRDFVTPQPYFTSTWYTLSLGNVSGHCSTFSG